MDGMQTVKSQFKVKGYISVCSLCKNRLHFTLNVTGGLNNVFLVHFSLLILSFQENSLLINE